MRSGALRTLVTFSAATSASAQFCCSAMMASCLACEAGISIEEYCALHPGEWDCPRHAQGIGDGGSKAPLCPPEAPRPFDACPRAGVSCGYDEFCCETTGVCLNTTTAMCESGMWVLMVAAVHCPVDELSPPASSPPVSSPPVPSIALCKPSDMVRCFAEPCKVTRCDAHPEARCFNDYCGGCHARFIDARTALPVTQCNLAAPPSPSKPRPPLSLSSSPPSALLARSSPPAAGAPPPSAPTPLPLTPELSPSTPAILVSVTAAGGVEDYDDAARAALMGRLATVARVPAPLVSLVVVPGSVRILASIAVPSSRRPADLSDELRSRLADVTTATNALGIAVTASPSMRITTVAEAREAQRQRPQVSAGRPEAPPNDRVATVAAQPVAIAEANGRAASGQTITIVAILVAALAVALGAVTVYALCKRRSQRPAMPVLWASRGSGSSSSLTPLPHATSSCRMDSKEMISASISASSSTSISTTSASPSHLGPATPMAPSHGLAAADAKPMMSDEDARVVTGVPVRPPPDTMYL